MKGSQFIKYLNPVLHVLRNNGGIGAASEIIDAVIEHLKIPEAEVDQTIPSGQSRVRNQIQWARYYLTKAGLMDSPKNGVWRLTQEGNQTSLTTDQAKALVQKIVKEYQDSRKAKESSAPVRNEDVAIVEDEEHSEDLLDTLKVMSPKGFEPAYRQAGVSANACSPRSASTISRSPVALAIRASMASAASA